MKLDELRARLRTEQAPFDGPQHSRFAPPRCDDCKRAVDLNGRRLELHPVGDGIWACLDCRCERAKGLYCRSCNRGHDAEGAELRVEPYVVEARSASASIMLCERCARIAKLAGKP